LEIHPPAYPLSRDAFKRALATGHGRALIHAQNFDVADYREDLLAAATTCLVYDTQIDGYREWWLARLCKAAGLIDAIIDLPPEGSAKDRAQRAAILKEFVRMGHRSALPKLYDMCSSDHPSDEITGCDELIEVDGEQGLIFVAKRLGAMLIRDPDFWIADWELTFFDERYGEGRGKAVLSEAALGDADIQAYLEKIRSYELKEEAGKTARPEAIEPVEQILKLIKASTKRMSRLRSWGRRAALKDRAKIVDLLTTEDSPLVLINALLCLRSDGLPSFDGALLRLVFHADDDVRFEATQVFSRHDEPLVRSAGLALLNQGDLRSGTQMLRLSARSADSEAILRAIGANEPGEDHHGILSNLIQLLEENDAIREPLIPLHIYEFSPCMLCRERAIEILIKWETCPQWVLDEAAQDASPDIRSLADSNCPPNES
jgi:hypothetical protein